MFILNYRPTKKLMDKKTTDGVKFKIKESCKLKSI